MRISWRRRRAWLASGIPASGRSLAPGSSTASAISRTSVQPSPVARSQRAVAVDQQHRHPQELLDLGQRALVLLVTVLLRTGGSEPGDIGHRLTPFLRQRRLVARGKSEAAQKSARPLEQRPGALVQRRVLAREQQLESEPRILDLGHGGLMQL